MSEYREHEITLASFAQIDREIGEHHFTPAEYAIARRVVHTTADFEFKHLIRFAHSPVAAATCSLQQGGPIVVDVSMVAAGIRGVASKTWRPPVVTAIKQVSLTDQIKTNQIETQQPQTRSAAGMRQCMHRYPSAIVAIGNAPTALLSLCEDIVDKRANPALVIGAPVGFINVVESKRMLQSLNVPYIVIEGRKGGSAVAAAIVNALMIWTWQQKG